MKTLTMKIVLPTLVALLAGMSLLATVLIWQQREAADQQLRKRAEASSRFVAAVAVPYVTNYDLTALGGFVKELTRDGEVGYAEFFGADGRSLTADLVPARPAAQLFMISRDIVDAGGQPVANFKLGMRRDALLAAQRGAILSVVAVIVAVLLAVFISVVLAVRRAVMPAQAMRGMLAEVAQGNLAIHAAEAGSDEIGEMAHSLNVALAALNHALRKVGSDALSVNQAAAEITCAAGSHAATSNEMAATVVEITSAMEELSATSTLIAEHAKAVVEIANATWESSKKGSEAMQGVLGKIGDISAENQGSLHEIVALGGKSKEISKIMLIINAVADQTKLIAFNAALEASSAGEAGRRFGVVAAEIRRLADSVTSSTGEIEGKINEIQDSISRLVITSEKGALGIANGMHATLATADSLDALVDAASQTSAAATQISLSTQQQKSASGQVVLALREIVNASAENALSNTRIAQASQDMNEMSSRLSALVGEFRLGDVVAG